MRYLIAFLLFLFPTKIISPICKLLNSNILIGGGKIGFSFLLADRIELHSSSRIGHFNFIKTTSLKMGENSRIKYFNIIKGRFNTDLHPKAVINQFNKITSRLDNERESTLKVGYNSIIGVKHIIDLTHNIEIGQNSILAGARSQIWTHGFYHPSDRIDHWRIDGEVRIGDNVYVGSSCIIIAGCVIADNITIGAGCVVSKSLNCSGLYVNQPLRFIDFKPEESISKYREVAPNIFER